MSVPDHPENLFEYSSCLSLFQILKECKINKLLPPKKSYWKVKGLILIFCDIIGQMSKFYIVFGLIFLSIVPSASFTQSLTGIWRGSFYNPTEVAMGGTKYRYEVQINNKGREVEGVTYSYQTTRFYGKASLVGMWSPTSKNFTLKEDRMLDLKIEGGGDGCLMTCYLVYKKEGGKEYLEGTYSSYNMNQRNSSCGGGRVFLERVPDTDFELEDFLVKKNTPLTKIVKPGQEDFVIKKPTPPVKTTPKPAPKAEPPVVTKKTPPPTPQREETVKKAPEVKEPVKPKPLPPAPAILKIRENELYKTIETSESEIEISFYDNGEIDGDTISVYNNNRLVAKAQGLSAKAIIIKVQLSDDDAEQDVIMVAENLGRIPPNTALMIIKAGDQRFTLNLTSTEQKNAMVKFRYKKAE
jgi:hypothetical protein